MRQAPRVANPAGLQPAAQLGMKEKSNQGGSAIFRIAGIGASVAFGVMVATLFALRPVADGFSFVINAPTVVAFLAAALFAWFYWRTVERMAIGQAPQTRKKKFLAFSAGIVVVGIISFLYPLKFIPAEKRYDVFFGLTLALLCVTGVGFVMWKVKRFLEADAKRTEEGE